MIQRIQTVYLLLVTVFMTLLILKNDNLTMQIIAALAGIIAFTSIFMYKNRTMQVRTNLFNIFVLLGLQCYICYNIYNYMQKKNMLDISFENFLPLISLIFTIMAILSIKKDIKLIKSLNRIR